MGGFGLGGLMVIAGVVAAVALALRNEGGSPRGYGGVFMSGDVDQTTRYLAASAFLRGPSFRRQVLSYLDDPNRAALPEAGVDLPLLAGVCQHAEERDRRYVWLFAAFALVALVLLAVETPPPIVILLLALVTGGVWYQRREQERRQVLAEFRRDRFDGAAVAKRYPVRDGLIRTDALPSPSQNLIVYSGFSPFVGAGTVIGGWSFAVATDKAKDAYGTPAAVIPFRMRQVYAAVGQAVQRLGLPSLSLRECFFVNGTDVRHDRTILPNEYGRPVQVLDFDSARHYMDASDARVRSYIWLQTRDWGGELVVSYLLRCSLRGPTMFVELKKFVLTPLPAELRQVDALRPLRFREKVTMALAVSPFAGLCQTALAPLRVLGYANEAIDHWLGRDRHRRRQIEDNPLFDYGSTSNVRSLLAGDRYVHYFQLSDKDLYDKTLDREILDALVSFLDVHNVDTSDLKERQSTILNSGVLVQGGNVNADTLAVGTGAKATNAVTNILRRATRSQPAAKGAA
jgi:hypothetical protein